MEPTAIGKARVRCPGCRRIFECDTDSRGCATKCPKCACDFLVPESGDEGVLLTTGDDSFDIVCPHCRTEFVLPSEYRGEIADCAECHGIFIIPPEGSIGQPVAAAPAAPAAAAPAPAAEPEPAPTAALPEASVPRRSATVFLSRKEVLDQAERAQRERMERLAQPQGIQRQAAPSPQAAAPEPAPAGRGVIDIRTSPVLEPLPARGLRRSELPDWLPALDFEKREKIIEFEEGAAPSMRWIKACTLVPVVLVPLAAVLGAAIHPAAAAAVCFVPALVFWGLAVCRMLPVIGHKVIILTNFRVIMADSTEVVDIDLV